MGYEYRPIVGQNYRYEKDRDKPFKLSRSKDSNKHSPSIGNKPFLI